MTLPSCNFLGGQKKPDGPHNLQNFGKHPDKDLETILAIPRSRCTNPICEHILVSSLPKSHQCFFTVRNRSCGKVMFSRASVILSTGGRCTPPWADTPSPDRQTPTLGRHPLPPRRPLQRTLRILLECILVSRFVSFSYSLEFRLATDKIVLSG